MGYALGFTIPTAMLFTAELGFEIASRRSSLYRVLLTEVVLLQARGRVGCVVRFDFRALR